MVVLWASLGGLLVLAGIAVYSALVLARRTDKIVHEIPDASLSPGPFAVRFPHDVFRRREP